MTGDILPAGGHRAFVIFPVAEFLCALARESVREILPLPHLWRPPGAARTLAGMLNLGGNAVPVLALRALFAQAEPLSILPYQHIILLRDTSEALGLLCDRVQDVVYADAAKLKPIAAEETLNGCAEAELELGDGRFAHVLAPDRILLHEEGLRIAELRATAAARISEWGE